MHFIQKMERLIFINMLNEEGFSDIKNRDNYDENIAGAISMLANFAFFLVGGGHPI